MAYGPLREIKLCLLGDTGVGKSSLVLRFVNDRFDPRSTSTIGASFMSKTFQTNVQTFKYQIWDTAGQEKYKALAPMYYRGAAAAIIVYDITCDSTFDSVKNWIRELQQLGPKNIVIAIAGNKCDLQDSREIELNTGREYAESINAIFAEVSALTADNVDYIFEEISKKLPPESEGYVVRGIKPIAKTEPKNSNCC